MGLYRTEAIVLGYRDLGEADKILTLLSPQRGKIHAVARGVRRPRNRLVGGTQLFSYSSFLLMEGRNLDIVSQCEIKESFYRIRGNLDLMAYGLYFAELLRASTPLEDKNQELFRFFLKTLYVMQEWEDLELFSRIFEIKLMAIQGFAPEIHRCVSCGGAPSGVVRFSPQLGGILCRKCLKKDEKALFLAPAALDAMKKMLKETYESLITSNVEEDVKKQLKSAMRPFVLHHLDRKLKTIQFIDDINNLKAGDQSTV
jgi:DNA repair protein RecO (recombination protein O)